MRWAVLLVVVTLMIYRPVVHAPFVYEDHNWSDTFKRYDVFSVSQWPGRYLTQWSYQAQADGFAVQPRPLHVMNVVIHLVTGGFVFVLARSIRVSATASVLASAIFLWHPLNVAAVAYISARSDLLMTLCTVLAVCAALTRTWWAMPFVIAAVLLAGAAKELGAIALFLVLWTWRAQVAIGAAALIPAVALSLTWKEWGVWWPHFTDWVFLVLANVMSLWRILWLMVVPIGLSIDPDPWFWMPPERVVGLMALMWLAVVVWKQADGLTRWGLGWMALVLLPRLVMPTFEPIHDQHAYVAMVAVSVLAGRAIEGVIL